MKKYYIYNVIKAVKINSLVTIEYINISPDFHYPIEEHTFYEFVYIDSGEIICNMDGKDIILNQHDFLLISPKIKHNYIALNNKKNTSIFIVCFNSSSQTISLIDGVFHFNKEEINLISNIFNESKNTFVFPFNRKIELTEKPVFGAQQIVEHCIEILLIKLIRNKLSNENNSVRLILNDDKIDNIIVDDTIKTLKNNLYNKITLEEIAKSTFYSKAYINKIFKKNMGKPIMQYYAYLKVEESKKLILENRNIKSIATLLCFNSPNYFSKVFFKLVGKTPSQYKNSINGK